jgi:hypothetical protein
MAEKKEFEPRFARRDDPRLVQTDVRDKKDNGKRIINGLFRLIGRCEKNLMPLFGKNDPMKELQETSVALYYIKSVLSHNKKYFEMASPDNTVVICHGDGITPRTGAVFAYQFPEWQVYSVDPMMQKEYTKNNLFPNLTCFNDYTQNVKFATKDKLVILVGVHSHADIKQLWETCSDAKARITYSNPCCGGFEWKPHDKEPYVNREETTICTVKNKIYVWLD